MAGSFSDVAEVDILKLVTGQATSIFTSTPVVPYIALYTVTPTDAGGGTEASGGSYARVSVAGKFGTPATGSVTNSTAISLAQFTGSVSSGAAFVAFGLFDAVTAGNLLCWGALTDTSKTGGSGDTITFAVSALTITLD